MWRRGPPSSDDKAESGEHLLTTNMKLQGIVCPSPACPCAHTSSRRRSRRRRRDADGIFVFQTQEAMQLFWRDRGGEETRNQISMAIESGKREWHHKWWVRPIRGGSTNWFWWTQAVIEQNCLFALALKHMCYQKLPVSRPCRTGYRAILFFF